MPSFCCLSKKCLKTLFGIKISQGEKTEKKGKILTCNPDKYLKNSYFFPKISIRIFKNLIKYLKMK